MYQIKVAAQEPFFGRGECTYKKTPSDGGVHEIASRFRSLISCIDNW